MGQKHYGSTIPVYCGRTDCGHHLGTRAAGNLWNYFWSSSALNASNGQSASRVGGLDHFTPYLITEGGAHTDMLEADPLFQPLRIKNTVIANRFAMPAMQMGHV